MAAADEPLKLSKADISALYGRYETIFGNANIESYMRIGPKTETFGRCPSPYTVLDVRTIENGKSKVYVVEIKESKPAHIKKTSRCEYGHGWRPFVAWRLPVVPGMPGLTSLEVWRCSSYVYLREIDQHSVADVFNSSAGKYCWAFGVWSPVLKGE